MRPFVVTAIAATIACHAAPRAVAEPRKPAAPSDAPLLATELKDDADAARALRESYTKYEYRIPMRDGVHLYTAAYVPKDASRRWPIVMVRTPYSLETYGVDAFPKGDSPAIRHLVPARSFIADGFIFVQQDVRGRQMSEGTFVDVRPHAAKRGDVDESTDAWDTIDFLVKNVPGNDGKVGTWGVSYPGFYAAQSAVDAHPALKAVSPQAPVTEWFLGDDFHHNGALLLADAFDFYASFGKPRKKPTKKTDWTGADRDDGDAYEFFLAMGPVANANAKYLNGDIAFWNDMVQHGTRDAFWQARDPRPLYRNVKPAVMTVGGWFDAEDLWGSLATYEAFEKQSPKTAENVLVMGPWSHGGWTKVDGDRLGDVAFAQKTSAYYREKLLLPFFQRHLKGKATPRPAEATVFETGTNTWQEFPAWPPPNAKKTAMHLGAGGVLAAAAPTDAGFEEWISDPKKPVPYRGQPAAEIEKTFMVDDQRFASHRTDVVVWSTPPLDADVTIGGPIEANLWVSTTGTDADFVVKVIDVYSNDYPDPDPNPTHVKMAGYQQLVRAEIMRGKFRTGFATPQPFEPGKPTPLAFTLPDVLHTFRAGHRIMVQIQSSWFPLVDRNPQTFTDIYKATDADFKAATQRVYRAPATPSNVTFGVLRGRLP